MQYITLGYVCFFCTLCLPAKYFAKNYERQHNVKRGFFVILKCTCIVSSNLIDMVSDTIWECLQIDFEPRTNKKLKCFYRRSVYVDPQSRMENVVPLPKRTKHFDQKISSIVYFITPPASLRISGWSKHEQRNGATETTLFWCIMY